MDMTSTRNLAHHLNGAKVGQRHGLEFVDMLNASRSLVMTIGASASLSNFGGDLHINPVPVHPTLLNDNLSPLSRTYRRRSTALPSTTAVYQSLVRD